MSNRKATEIGLRRLATRVATACEESRAQRVLVISAVPHEGTTLLRDLLQNEMDVWLSRGPEQTRPDIELVDLPAMHGDMGSGQWSRATLQHFDAAIIVVGVRLPTRVELEALGEWLQDAGVPLLGFLWNEAHCLGFLDRARRRVDQVLGVIGRIRIPKRAGARKQTTKDAVVRSPSHKGVSHATV